MKLLSELVTIITQIPESRLLKVPTSADEGKLPVIRADIIPAVYHDTTLAAIVIEGDKVIDKISGKELTKVGSPQIIDSGIHSPTNSDYYMLELEGVEGLPVAVSFDYQGDESPDSSNIVTINGSCAYYSLNGVSFCRSQGGGNNIKIDNQPVGVSEAYRNYVMQVSSDNYESKMPPVAFIAGESKSPTYEGSFPAMSPLSSVKVCGRFGKIRNILIGSAFPYTGNFTPRGDGVEGFGVPEKREPGWNYETLDEAADKATIAGLTTHGIYPNALAKSGAVDFNEVIDHGFYFIGGDTPHLNYPETYQQNGGTLQVIRNGNYLTQTFIPLNINKAFIRSCLNVLSDSSERTFSAWRRLLTDTEITESKARPGYFKLPGGTIVQWGAASNITADGITQITFPVAFPNAFLIGNATAVSGNASASGVVVSLAAVLSTGMLLLTKNHPGNGNDINVHWLAIGY